MASSEHVVGARVAFLGLVALVVVGLGYVSYRADQTTNLLRETIQENCRADQNRTRSLISLHEDIAASFAPQGKPVPMSIMADLAELRRLVPTCKGL